MRSRVILALFVVSGCSAPALKNWSEGNYGGESSGESSGTASTTGGGSSGSSSEGGSGGWESSGGASSSSGDAGSAGTTASTTEDGSGSSSTTTTGGVESTGSSGSEPVCGDGVVEGDEECDDGGPGSGCNEVCGRDRLVFATDELFQPSQVGGAKIADDICKQAAGLAGLPNWGTYTAWVSDSTSNAIDRTYHGRGRYLRPDGVEVAASFAALLAGPLKQPIVVTEWGEPTFGGAWTGTRADGTLTPGLSHCKDWTINGPADYTTNGALAATDARWTQMPDPEPCGGELRLYCFEGK